MEQERLITWMKIYADKIEDNKSLLNDYDTPIGDGDHGTNMSRGMQAVLEALSTKKPETNNDILKTVGMTLLSKVGGASGPLYGSAFIAMSKTVNDATPQEVIKSGYDAIASRGKSTQGEKTMLDVWGPISEYESLAELTEQDVQSMAAKTDAMKATKGRASFLGERSIGHRDPGSVSSQLLFESAIEAEVFK